MTQKARSTKGKIYVSNLIKTKNFFSTKYTINRNLKNKPQPRRKWLQIRYPTKDMHPKCIKNSKGSKKKTNLIFTWTED